MDVHIHNTTLWEDKGAAVMQTTVQYLVRERLCTKEHFCSTFGSRIGRPRPLMTPASRSSRTGVPKLSMATSVSSAFVFESYVGFQLIHLVSKRPRIRDNYGRQGGYGRSVVSLVSDARRPACLSSWSYGETRRSLFPLV